MSFDKYSWDTQVPETTHPGTINQDNIEKPLTQQEAKIQLEDILTVPKETINQDSKTLKEIEDKEDETDVQEASLESLREVLHHIQSKQSINREDRETILSIQPNISLESANCFTMVDSTNGLEETIKPLFRQTIIDNHSIVAKRLTDTHSGMLKMLTQLNSDKVSLSVSFKTKAHIFLNNGYNKQITSVLLLSTLKELSRVIQEKTAEAKQTLKTTRVPEDIEAALENYLTSVSDIVTENTIDGKAETVIEQLIISHSNQPVVKKLLGLLNGEDPTQANIIQYAFDYLNGHQPVLRDLTEKILKSNNRFNDKLDHLNKAMVILFNALLDYSTDHIEQHKVIAYQQYVEQALVDYLKTQESNNRDYIMLKDNVTTNAGYLVSGILNSNIEQLENVLVQATKINHDNVESFKACADFYLELLNTVDNALDDTIPEPTIQSGLETLTKAVNTISEVVCNNIVSDGVQYSNLRTYCASIMSVIYLIYETFAHFTLDDINNRHVQDALAKVNLAAKRGIEIFHQYSK